MIEQDVIHAKQIKALSFPLVALKFTNMGRVNRQACLYTAFRPANWAKSWVQIELAGITGRSSRNIWPWVTTSTSILQRTFGTSLGLNFNLKLLSIFRILLRGDLNLHLEILKIFCFAGSQPQLGNSRNILLRWVSTSTWLFSKYFSLLGSQPQFQNTWIICDIPTGFKFWNHWVFLLLFLKKATFQL